MPMPCCISYCSEDRNHSSNYWNVVGRSQQDPLYWLWTELYFCSRKDSLRSSSQRRNDIIEQYRRRLCHDDNARRHKDDCKLAGWLTPYWTAWNSVTSENCRPPNPYQLSLHAHCLSHLLCGIPQPMPTFRRTERLSRESSSGRKEAIKPANATEA